MAQHYWETKYQVNKGLMSYYFAKHFTKQFLNQSNEITVKDARDLTTLEIVWQRYPLTCAKSFGKLSCTLYMKERLEMMKALSNEPTKSINSQRELYSACRHRPRSHRYTSYVTSIDEG